MKKLTQALIMIFICSGISYAQSAFRPSLQVVVKGAYAAPLSHQEFVDGVSGFPGIQLEVAYDINSNWGVYGNFSSDFLSAKNSTTSSSAGTFEQTTSTQLTGYVGPRYYVNMPSASLLKLFFDAGVGIYSIKLGDQKLTSITNPPTSITASYTSVSQTGVNLGTGINVAAGTNFSVNLGAKYHFVFKKDDAALTQTVSTGISREIQADLPEHSYIQFTAGIGYRFGF